MTERWLGMKKEAGRKELFESMPVGSALMTMAIPTIISQLINLVYNMVDTIYIGRTGDAYKTAAVTLAFTIFMMTIALSNLFGIGGGSLMARLSGSGKADRAKSVCAFSFYGAIGIAILYSIGYLYEHREEADHHALTLTLRSLLFGVRKEAF